MVEINLMKQANLGYILYFGLDFILDISSNWLKLERTVFM